MELINKLNWRYATKRMNGEKISPEKLNTILQSIRLSASSFGLQPYKLIVIENEEIRKSLQKAANNQPQITEASHLLVFVAFDKITEKHIDDYIQLHARTRNTPIENLGGFKGMLAGALLNRSEVDNFNWSAKQIYIALGTALIAAANEGVDATPMEGFNAAEFDEILGLKEKGLKSVVILTLGYRDEANDPLVKATKVRKDDNDFFIKIN
jgi:nitroreductase/dihydropteridine reductase